MPKRRRRQHARAALLIASGSPWPRAALPTDLALAHAQGVVDAQHLQAPPARVTTEA
jgi:hypothetical protein